MICAPAGALRGGLAATRRWALLAVMLVGAAVPWYTLRVFPLATIGSATLNLLDLLVGLAVLLSAPATIRALRSGERGIAPVLAFLAYMIVPFALGLSRDPRAWFYGVRESRALAFYALAPAFAAGRYTPRDYLQFAAAYAIGAVIAVVAAAAHVLWHSPLPGYPAMIGYTPSLRAGVIVRYLDWTVPVVAFLFCLAGVLRRDAVRIRAVWALGLCCAVWYLIAMHERTAEGAALVVAVMLMLAPSLGGFTWRRAAVAVAGLLAVAGIGRGVISAPHWIRQPAERMLAYWVQLGAGDGSVQVRIREWERALPEFRGNPFFGGGLGSIVEASPPDFPGAPWRYMSSGYGYLLVKTGIVGLGLYLAMVGYALQRGWRMMRSGAEIGAWPQWSVGTAGMGALLALNLTHPVVDIPEGAIAFSLFFGMLVAGEPPAAPRPAAGEAASSRGAQVA